VVIDKEDKGGLKKFAGSDENEKFKAYKSVFEDCMKLFA